MVQAFSHTCALLICVYVCMFLFVLFSCKKEIRRGHGRLRRRSLQLLCRHLIPDFQRIAGQIVQLLTVGVSDILCVVFFRHLDIDVLVVRILFRDVLHRGGVLFRPTFSPYSSAAWRAVTEALTMLKMLFIKPPLPKGNPPGCPDGSDVYSIVPSLQVVQYQNRNKTVSKAYQNGIDIVQGVFCIMRRAVPVRFCRPETTICPSDTKKSLFFYHQRYII